MCYTSKGKWFKYSTLIVLSFHYFISSGQQIILDLDNELKHQAVVLSSSVIDKIEYIIPETTPESVFFYPSFIHLVENHIYFYDQKLSQFFIFRKDGKFIKRFGEIGRGPNEYVRVKNFFYDPGSKNFIIYSEEHKILRYNLKGEVVESYEIKSNPFNLLVRQGQFYGFFPFPTCMLNNGFSLSSISQVGKIQHNYYKNDYCENGDIILFNSFYLFGDSIRFWDSSMNQVLSCDARNNVAPFLQFRSKRLMPKQYLSSMDQFQNGAHNFITIHKIMESARFLFIRGRATDYGTGMYIMYDKNQKVARVLQDNSEYAIGIKDDLLGPWYYWPLQILDTGEGVCYFEIIDLKNYYNETNEDNYAFSSQSMRLNPINSIES